jgi:hypothetical protein
VTPRRSLSPEERETIIRFDETSNPASVFTYNRRWQQHIEKRLGIKPDWSNHHGGRQYSVPKSRISVPRAPRKVSEATLARLRAQARARSHSSGPS